MLAGGHLRPLVAQEAAQVPLGQTDDHWGLDTGGGGPGLKAVQAGKVFFFLNGPHNMQTLKNAVISSSPFREGLA